MAELKRKITEALVEIDVRILRRVWLMNDRKHRLDHLRANYGKPFELSLYQ